jgi:hypothetical protein
MIKKLIFTAALLAPGLAYGGNPSANLTVQIDPVSNSSACDVGPNYIGSIPAAAAQAGFTHCAANYDFTQTSSFTDSNGNHQWSNLSSWRSCSGSASSPFIMGFNGDVPCDTNHQNITTDSGTQVLALSYFLTDEQAGHFGNSGVTFGPNGSSTPYAVAYYIEMVVKTTTSGICSNFCLVWDMSTFTNEGPTRCFVSQDSEFDQGGSGSGLGGTLGLASWNFPCGSTHGGGGTGPAVPVLFPVPSGTAYTTYGSLVTADNVSQYGACDYSAPGAVSGLPASSWLSCVTSTVGGPVGGFSPFVNNLYIYLAEGPQSAGQGGTNWTASSHTTFIQRVTVWECSGYQTGQCYNNPVITTHP